MRPIPWTVRLILFAVGFGAGLSQYKAPAQPTHRPVVIEIRVKPDLQPAVSEPRTHRSESSLRLQNRI
ncbi:MAG TPA: hypothetical protein VFR18_27475 [Terriglobia bacterium]|nr:hypothetical protein [Terriglobia bacterium]